MLVSLFPQYFQFLGQTFVFISHIMEVYGVHLKSMHREVQIKHDLMTRKCKYTLMEDTKQAVYVRNQYL